MLLLVSFVAVPVMLFAKPLCLYFAHKRELKNELRRGRTSSRDYLINGNSDQDFRGVDSVGGGYDSVLTVRMKLFTSCF